MARSQLEDVLSSRVLPIVPGRRHHRLLDSSGKPHTQFAEEMLGLWERRNCSVYENYLQSLGVRTGNTVEMALEPRGLECASWGHRRVREGMCYWSSPDLGLHEGKGGEGEKKRKICSSIIHTLFTLLSGLAFLLRETFIWNISDIYKYREDSTLR